MGDPLISVIIPVYNIAPYLSRCLDSVLAQTYNNIEIIAVDDGSTDGSAAILDQYRMARSDRDIRVIHLKNGGVTRARLSGVFEADGEYIGFVDGDDYIDPDLYERLMRNLREHQADISHCGYQMVFPDRTEFYYNTGFRAVWDRDNGLKELLSGKRIEPGVWNKLYRKELFLCYAVKNPATPELAELSVRNMEDLLMNYRLFRQAASSVYEDFCPYHYMIRRGSASTGNYAELKMADTLKVLRMIERDCEERIARDCGKRIACDCEARIARDCEERQVRACAHEQAGMHDERLRQIVTERIAGALTRLATVPDENRPAAVPDENRPAAVPDESRQARISRYRLAARRELRGLCPEIIKGDYSWRIKCMVLWAAFSPDTYRFAHDCYAKIHGTYRRYEI